MDPVSGADRFVRLMQAKLAERAKLRSQTPSGPDAVRYRESRAVSDIAGTLARAGAEDAQVRRALVEQLLADRFGPGLVNDARFQNMVDRIATMMSEDREVDALVAETLTELRARTQS